MRRLFARKRPRDDEEGEGEEGAERRHAPRKAAAADGRAESGAVDGSAAESGVTTTHVARGDEDASGVARAVGESTKKKKKCVLCKTAQARRGIDVWHLGSKISDIFGPILYRFSRRKREQIKINKSEVICKGDGLCIACALRSGQGGRDLIDLAFERRMEDTRKVVIFAKHVQEKCHGKLPRQTDCAELEGWEHESAGAARVQVGRWWYSFTTTKDGARKKRVVEAAARDDDTKTQEALQYLATCERRNDSKLDVEGDSRRVRILAMYVEEKCDGKLPRTRDCAELEGWDHESAGAARVQVGRWWYEFTTTNDGARKKRVVEAAARDDDEAKTREALQYLATCEKRNHSDCDVEGDSRRVRILAMYVEEKCHGKLPRTRDCAELEGWDHESAGTSRVQVGRWWCEFTTRNDGARKKRVVEAAARDDDEAKTQEALQYLATRPQRDEKKRSR